MVDQIKSRWPDWLTVPVMLGALQMVAMLIVLTVWASNKASIADQTSLALAGVNTRLDRVFEKIDNIGATLPVLQEKLSQDEAAINDAKGVWASADLRLRAIENNNAANHSDIEQLSRKVR